MGLFDKIFKKENEAALKQEIPGKTKLVFMGKEYVISSQVAGSVSDEHSKELYDMALSKIPEAEEAMRKYISDNYSDLVEFHCEGFTLPDDTSSQLYADLKLLTDEYNALMFEDSFDAEAKKGLESMMRILKPNEITVMKDYVSLGIFASAYESEGYEVLFRPEGISVRAWE